MSENLRLIIDNVHDSATLTATSEALPVAYTQRSGRAYVWRSVGIGEQVIEATFATPLFLTAVVVYRHNFSATADVKIEVLNGADVAYQSGFVNVSGVIPLGEFQFGIDAWGATGTEDLPVKQAPFWIPATLATGYRITITDTDSVDGYIQVGRIIAGAHLSPKYNAAYGLQLEWQDYAEHRRTEGATLRTVGGGLARRLPIDLNFLDDPDRSALSSAFLRNGKRSDVYISVFPTQGGLKEGEYAFMARRENHYSHTLNFHDNWQSQLIFVEV